MQILVDIIIGIGSPALVGWVARNYIKGFIDHSFNRELETHKHALAAISDKIKFDYQRRISDFNLYNAQRHKTYPSLYKAILEAHGAAKSLSIGLITHSFDGYSESEIDSLLVERRIGEAKRQEITRLWNVDRGGSVQEVLRMLRIAEVNDARHSWSQAKNLWLSSELYLSEDVTEACKQVLDPLIAVITKFEFERYGLDHKDITALLETGDAKLSVLKESMKEDLSRGDYTSDSES